MATRRGSQEQTPNPPQQLALPTICAVTTDEEFLQELIPELIPWFQVVLRENFEDLARRARDARVSAVLLDIDTQGGADADAHGGLPVLNELRRLNLDLVLVSLSRSRTRSVEKPALDAGVFATEAEAMAPCGA